MKYDTMKKKLRHIALILNVNKAYDRKVVSGVSRYMREVGNWSLYLENEPLSKIPDLNSWNGDGIIADLDDSSVYEAVSQLSIPVVGFGGGYGPYRKDDRIPYVYTDNHSIATSAAEHLIERGYRRFAYCGLPATAINGWSHERNLKFLEIIEEKGLQCSQYNGKSASPQKWENVLNDLKKWLKTLQFPCALFAANDSRARHVLEACSQLDIKVPEDLAVLGVDNDEMMCELSNPPLSSIIQGTSKLGYEAACILDSMIDGQLTATKTVIEPLGIQIRQSTDMLAIENPLISQAIAYIRKQACYSVRVEEVARYCNVSRANLEKKFKKIMGHTVYEEISRMQLKNVEDLLINTDLTLKKVADLSGFSTVQYMNSKLKAFSGLTPQQFREKKSPFLKLSSS